MLHESRPSGSWLIFDVRQKSMLRISFIGILVFAPARVLPKCGRGWPDVYWQDGRYTLIAIDAPEQMTLAHSTTSSSIVPSTVFSIGANDEYIVLKQHPGIGLGGFTFDRSVTNYFIVKKKKSSDFREVESGVRGPLTKEEFEKLTVSLSLPAFSKTFDDLK